MALMGDTQLFRMQPVPAKAANSCGCLPLYALACLHATLFNKC